jgi:hypothetical protein
MPSDQKGHAMTLIRVAPYVIASALAVATSASAQMFGPAMGPPGAQQFGPPMGPPPAQQGAPPCMAEFVPLRQEAEKRAAAIKAGADRKAPREEICGLFKRFSDAESKVVKFLSANQATCGIPPQAIVESKANHAKTATTAERICSGGGVEGAKPRGTGLGEALGVRAVPTPETTKNGKGIFDTLSGTQPDQ